MTDEQNDLPVEPQKRPRRDADKGREPEFLQGRSGTRAYSIAALVEKIESQFYAEYSPDSPLLAEADTPAKRLRLLLDVANYVLAVESIQLDSETKARLIERVYSGIFGYGALDQFFLDSRVTTISIEGAENVAVRFGNLPFTSYHNLFDDDEDLQRVIKRLVTDAGAELRDDTPILETGLLIGDRPARVSVVAPPYAAYLSADIRLHPASAPTLDDLVETDFMSADAADLLRAIARSTYGFCIVGEPESGKTTLLNALLQLLPDVNGVYIERAAELRPPQNMRRMTARWRIADQPEVTFGQRIAQALDLEPSLIILDEVRADEPDTLSPLLMRENTPRQIWACRGAPDAKRLQSALGMIARRANIGAGEVMVHRMYERLPFVITVSRIGHPETGESLRLFSVAEWQPRTDSEYPDYRLLMQFRDGEARRTDVPLARELG